MVFNQNSPRCIFMGDKFPAGVVRSNTGFFMYSIGFSNHALVLYLIINNPVSLLATVRLDNHLRIYHFVFSTNGTADKVQFTVKRFVCQIGRNSAPF